MLPAAASLQKQGANRGATTAFLISTPESGVDSIAITYALLDPIMTIIRPVAAFVTAISAGMLENYLRWNQTAKPVPPPMAHGGNCCGSEHPDSGQSAAGISVAAKISAGFRYAVVDVWGEIALWFYLGLAVAAVITVMVPEALMVDLLGGGLASMVIMLLIGVPLYICATASTPIAAALILKGVSPGAALVFLLVGPATNITSLSVLFGLLGRRSTIRYLLVLSISAVLFGLGVDQLYAFLDISPKAVIGEATELIPEPVKIASVMVLVLFSIKPLYHHLKKLFSRPRHPNRFVTGFPELPGKNKNTN